MGAGTSEKTSLSGQPVPAPLRSGASGSGMQAKVLKKQYEELQKEIAQVESVMAAVEVRKHALEDFYFFCTNVMGFVDLYRPLHGPLCELIANDRLLRKLVLLPRGHFKTTIISICYPLWLLCKDQNNSIALCSVSASKAEENLEEVIDRAKGARFQAIFGDVIGHPTSWTICRVDKVKLKRSGTTTGPSIAAYGVESSEVGRHFSQMLLDDIADQTTVNTQYSRDKAWQWLGRQLSVLNPGSQLIILGTRWHWDDVYSRVQKELRKWSEDYPLGWFIEKRKVIEDGKLIFPTRFNREELAEIKKLQGDYIFSCFYYNEPVGEGINPFDLRKFQWIDYERPEESEDEEEQIQTPLTHIFVDPAASEAETACFSGILVIDALHSRKIVVREAILERMHPDKLVDRIFELVGIHQPIRVAIEEEAYQKSLLFWIRREMLERGEHFQIVPVRMPRNITKFARLAALQPFIHNGDIMFQRDMPGKEHIIEEFETYPKGPHTDLIAAMAMLPFCTIYPSKRRVKKQEPELPPAALFFQKLERKAKRRSRRMPKVRIRGMA